MGGHYIATTNNFRRRNTKNKEFVNRKKMCTVYFWKKGEVKWKLPECRLLGNTTCAAEQGYIEGNHAS